MLLGCNNTQSILYLDTDKLNENKINELLKIFNKTVSIDTVKFNPQRNTQVALALQNGIIYLYDFNKNTISYLIGHKANVFDVAFSPNGALLASAGYDDNTVKIWDVAQQKVIQDIPLSQQALKVAFSPDGLYLAITTVGEIAKQEVGTIIIWDIKQNKKIRQLQSNANRISAIVFSHDGEWLVTAGYGNKEIDKKVYIWKWQSGELAHILPHDLSITSIALSPDRKWLITGQKDGLIQWWNIGAKHTFNNVKNEKLFEDWIPHLLFTSDMKYLISISFKNKIIIQQFPTALVEKEITILKNISRIDLSSDNKNISISVQDGTVRIYDFQQKQLQHLLVVSDVFDEWLSCHVSTPQCIKNNPPIDWIKFLKSYWGIIITGITFLVFMLLLFYVRIYKHPLVLQLSDYPQDLLKLPLQQLPEANKLLRLTRRLNTVLARCEISHITFNHAISFLYATPKQQAQILSQNLMSTSEAISNHIFLVKFTTLRLNLDNCLFYFPETHLLASDILQQLEYQEIFREKKVIIITTALEKQQALRPYGENLHNEWIVPNAFELTQLLLSATPVETFSRLLSTQLSLVKISPYQISGALRKDESFFGRTSIISDILSRHLKNYLVVGGRQIGKSSLLQYLYRKLSKRTDINAFYYQYLYGENIIQRLAICLGLEENSSIEQIMNYLTTISKPCIFLLDEIDGLIEIDKQLGYFNLYQLRSLSANGNCYFILAGVWYLHQAAISEYGSPLRNFGELITLAELEHSACDDLIVKPLSALGISFASKSLIDYLIQQTGQRANLIALVCHEIVRQVDKTTPIIDEPMLRYVLCHHNIQEMFGTQPEQTLDKIIMYLTVQKDRFTLEDISNELIKYHYSSTITDIKNALKRLTLELVLKEVEHQTYIYAIPLMRENLLQYDITALIDELTTTVSFDEEV